MIPRIFFSLLLLSPIVTFADTAAPMVNQVGSLPVAATRELAMKFAVVEYSVPSTAQATATITNGFVTSITLASPGTGYTAAPVVTLQGGGGSGAKAVAFVANGGVMRIDVRAAGAHYTTAPEVIVAVPTAKSAVTTLWSNDETSSAGSEPNSAVTLQISGGTYSALLGYTGIPNMSALPEEVLTHTDARVRVWYRPGAGAFKRYPIDQPLQQSVYAQAAGFATMAGAVADGSVSLSSFAPGLVNSLQAAPFQNIEFPSLTTDQLTVPTFPSGTFATGNPYFTARDTTGGVPGELLAVTNVFGNALALQNVNEAGYSAVTFRSASGAEHGAFGIGGNSVSDGFVAYKRNMYIEATDANLEGWSPSFMVTQETTYGGTRPFGNNIRILLNSQDGFLTILPRGKGTNLDVASLEGGSIWFFDPDSPIVTGAPYADLRGGDQNWSVVFRSGGGAATGNDYSCIAGTLAAGGGHRFYTGGRTTDLGVEIAKDRSSINNLFHLQPQSRPDAGSQGDVYCDQADGHLYFFTGGAWKQLDPQ